MTEANRDEALKCDGLSKRYFDQKDYELAYKYAEKSVKLFNTEYSVKWLEKVRKEAATGQVENSAKYTKGQKEEVERFLKIDREDFYAILGVPKGAEDVDIKRAYRKVRRSF